MVMDKAKKKQAHFRIRIDPLDTLFSEYIRRKSGGCCQRCGVYHGWKGLACCHFNGRGLKSVRWDEDNVMAGCMGCHAYLDAQPMEKVHFFRNLLGEERFNLLESRKRITYPKPDKVAIALYLRMKIAELIKDENTE
ncbi:hypothetical protein LCGC14_2755690 [marine sediment metagenome]|uniref:Uncharacterized protein n=1 Tax=marine sediment metagenome TaxID=412755 RepID=A0A0F8Z0L4_9ZZZZ